MLLSCMFLLFFSRLDKHHPGRVDFLGPGARLMEKFFAPGPLYGPYGNSLPFTDWAHQPRGGAPEGKGKIMEL